MAAKQFGYPTLRESQKEVLGLIHGHRQILATLPTGGGKSLLYSLPPVVWQKGMCVVICPLIALMRDQVRRLESVGVASGMLTSEQTEEEKRLTRSRLKEGKIQILFVSPERFLLPRFIDFLSKQKIALAVVDEAHCVVSWGVDFRPEYFELKQALQALQPSKVLLLTATASKHSRKVISQVVFPYEEPHQEWVAAPLSPQVFLESCRVFSEDEKWLTLVDVLEKHKEHNSIIYFTRRDSCEEAASKLRKLGHKSLVYHAGMLREQKLNVEQYLHGSSGSCVVCATTAFGMGVDISRVRLVVAFGFPANIEEYFQMMGRAGRGGESARALLLWSGSDPIKREFQLKKSFLVLSELNLYLQRFMGLFPGVAQQVYLSPDQVKAKMGWNQEQWAQNSAVWISCLRALGALDRLRRGEESIWEVELSPKLTLQDLLSELPGEPTKRSLLLGALGRIQGKAWTQTPGAKGVFWPSEILAESGLKPSDIPFIFQHFTQKGSLTWHTQAAVKEAFILKGSYAQATLNLPFYLKLKEQARESLQQLQDLAQAKGCRQEKAHLFFGEGTHKGAVSKPRHQCMQCDLCLIRSKNNNKQGLFWSFKDFRESSAPSLP